MGLTIDPIPCQTLASMELRIPTVYLPVYQSAMLPPPDIEGPRVLVVVCPRGIGGGPTLSQVTVAVSRRWPPG